jgi:MFS family permease
MIFSATGTRMQAAAVLWHVHNLSGQAIALGNVGLVSILPVLAFSLLAGAAADALNRRRLMFLTQTTLAALAALLGWFTQTRMDSLALIYGVVAASAAASTFDLPARQSLVPNLVPTDDLTNAFSLNAIAFQVGSIVGPAVGGLVLANMGLAYAYWINAASYLAVILALLLMGKIPQEREAAPTYAVRPGRSVLHAVRTGLRFVTGQPVILSSMLLDFFATFFSSATYLLPIFAVDILGVGVQGYGWLISAPPIGAGLVALALAFRRTIRNQGRVLLVTVAGFGLATIVFGLSRSYALTFIALAMTGATDSVSMIIRNTIRQVQTPDRLRGRMTSVNQIFFMGGPYLGEVEAGIVGQIFGAPFAVISGGIGCLAALAWINARFPQLRRYRGDEPVLAGKPAAPPSASVLPTPPSFGDP